MFKRNHRRGLGKMVLAGSLVAALSVPVAGAASAAPVNYASNGYATVYAASSPATVNWTQLASQYGFDLNTLVQQIQKNLANGGAGYVTVPGQTSGAGTGTSAGSTAGTGSANGSSHASTGRGSKAGTSSGSKTGTGSAAGSSQAGVSAGSKTGAGSTTGSGSSSKAGSGTSGSGSAAGSSASSGSSVAQSDFAAQVVSLVNQERAKAGLKALKSDSKLTTVALAKAKDMYAKNYFDHNSPTYGSPFDMMKQYGVTYSYAGENIAKGQQNPQAVMNAWMNSSGHRANILNANYSSIGVAYYNGEWVQEFTG